MPQKCNETTSIVLTIYTISAYYLHNIRMMLCSIVTAFIDALIHASIPSFISPYQHALRNIACEQFTGLKEISTIVYYIISFSIRWVQMVVHSLRYNHDHSPPVLLPLYV
jgi:hypothetical protein